MKHIKHIHDEDYDFSIKLMVPLLSILVCTICLCATTWAWYTASVSTGVTSIKAKANVTESVSCVGECNYTKIDDGEYVLEPSVAYTLTFQPGDAQNGYIALIDLEDYVDSQTNTASIIDLFVNRVYADEPETQTLIADKGYVLVNKSNEADLEIPITVSSRKVLKIQYIWCVVENDQIVWGEYQDYRLKQFTNASGISLQEPHQESRATVTLNFINATTNELLPYSALGSQTYGLNEDENQPQTATVVFKADSDEIVISAPDGYLLLMDDIRGETDNVESRVYRIETDKDIVINVYCVEIPQNNVNDPVAQDPVPEGESNVNDTVPPDIENNTGESNISDAGTSDDTDKNESPSIPNTGETDSENKTEDTNGEDTIESLLIANPVDEGTTNSIPPSTNESLETGTSEE